jgi:hypothetical protein
VTRKDLKQLLREVIREELATLSARALPLRSQGDQCGNEKEKYASTKTNETGSGEFKSPAQMARELLKR